MEIELAEGSFDALIFDCDGTLVDTAPAHYHAIKTAYEQHDLTMPASWYYARVGLMPSALMDAYEAEFGKFPVPRSALSEAYSEVYHSRLNQLQEVAVVAEIARRWQGRVPMAVASNGHCENVQATLRSVNLLSLFSCVVAVEDVPQGKPAPDLFLEAARRPRRPESGLSTSARYGVPNGRRRSKLLAVQLSVLRFDCAVPTCSSALRLRKITRNEGEQLECISLYNNMLVAKSEGASSLSRSRPLYPNFSKIWFRLPRSQEL